MSNLVDHARRELHALGVAKDDEDLIVPVIQAFANGGHSGSSAAWSIAVIHDLLQFKPLTSLTDDPAEWNLIVQKDLFETEDDIWQNRRDSGAFSNDGGKTYYLVDEVKNGYKKYYYTEEKNGETSGRNDRSE